MVTATKKKKLLCTCSIACFLSWVAKTNWACGKRWSCRLEAAARHRESLSWIRMTRTAWQDARRVGKEDARAFMFLQGGVDSEDALPLQIIFRQRAL